MTVEVYMTNDEEIVLTAEVMSEESLKDKLLMAHIIEALCQQKLEAATDRMDAATQALLRAREEAEEARESVKATVDMLQEALRLKVRRSHALDYFVTGCGTDPSAF